ncbi:MAG: TenA family protein [Proteobacteria bacterium]|nr:TenA family protein [Pseudomonadota bacterium]MDA1357407.1 TenA family protein [Pseudomonadota bacterium]
MSEHSNGSLFVSLREANADAWRNFTAHPFVKALADGSLPETAFRHYLIQDFLFLRHFARAYGLAAYKAESLEEIRAASQGLQAILNVEIGLHEAYCADWGVDSATLESALEDSATLAYTRYVLERGMAGDLLDLYVALAPCVIGYGEIGARLIADNSTRMKGNRFAAWIEMYGGKDYQTISADAVHLLDRVGKARGADLRITALSRTFGEATRLEAAFWQMGLAAGE